MFSDIYSLNSAFAVFQSLMNIGSPCVADLGYYFVSKLTDNFGVVYGVDNCSSNDCGARLSTIIFVQGTELISNLTLLEIV